MDKDFLGYGLLHEDGTMYGIIFKTAQEAMEMGVKLKDWIGSNRELIKIYRNA